MDLSDDATVGALLAALVHDVVQPMASAYLHAHSLHTQVRELFNQLQRTDRSLRAMRWLATALRFPEEAKAERQPRRLVHVLDAVSIPSERFSLDVPAELSILAPPCVPEMVIDTLLSNTQRYAGGCRVEIWTQVEQRPGGRVVLLTVADDGPGISAAARAQLFDPKAASAGGGMGIGLWLAQLMTRCNGGDLQLDETARGSSFTSEWPYAVAQAEDSFPLDLKEFGAVVRNAREAAGLTREQLSGRAGIASTTIRNIETARHRPQGTVRLRLLHALGLL